MNTICIIFEQRELLLPIILAPLITSECVYFDSFLFILFFSSGISEIWPHLETVNNFMFSMALPIRSNYSCRGSTEKMSISYKSFTNKHYVFLLRVPGCSSKWSNNVHSLKWLLGAPASFFSINNCSTLALESLPVYGGAQATNCRVCVLKIITAPITFMARRCGTGSLYVQTTWPSSFLQGAGTGAIPPGSPSTSCLFPTRVWKSHQGHSGSEEELESSLLPAVTLCDCPGPNPRGLYLQTSALSSRLERQGKSLFHK